MHSPHSENFPAIRNHSGRRVRSRINFTSRAPLDVETRAPDSHQTRLVTTGLLPEFSRVDRRTLTQIVPALSNASSANTATQVGGEAVSCWR
jgi:hypothetical protein